VRDDVIKRGHQKIRQLLAEGKTEKGTGIDLEDRAYLTYALSTDTGEDSKPANELNELKAIYARSKDLQPYGKALLALALNASGDTGKASALAAELEKSAIVNEVDAHWESKRRPMLDFIVENDIEATAFGIKALAALRPSSPILPKLARWLTANKTRGYYWETTKKTAFAIFGLTDYLRVSKELQPDYSLEVYLNGERVVERRVNASDAASGQTFVVERKGPAAGGANTVRVVKRGRGVVYIASTIDYFTNEETIAAKASPELSLTREYQRLRISESRGKPQWKLEPLTGKLESGDLIVSRLKVKGSRAQYLMIEDPIPAGCEQIERVSGIELGWAEGKWSDWYSSREFRDRRTAIFVDSFDGDATFQYALRVITPGDFRVAPARAELMYRPSVRTNSNNLKFTFSDRK
jgi:alpha-2-macroglobulin